MYARKQNAAWVEWDGKPLPFIPGDPTEKFHVPKEWSDAEKRTRFGLYLVRETPIPSGKRLVFYSLVDDGGEPSRLDVLEDIPVTVDDLLAYAAAKRWQVETAGLNVGGAMIDTSIESQNRINGAYNFATANPGVLISFKAETGFVKLTSEQAIAIGQVVGAHVQAGFATEEAVIAAIEAGTITSIAEIDAADWPG
jgi:hypothetical protein